MHWSEKTQIPIRPLAQTNRQTKRVLACFIRLSKSRYSQASWKGPQTNVDFTRPPTKVKRFFRFKFISSAQLIALVGARYIAPGNFAWLDVASTSSFFAGRNTAAPSANPRPEVAFRHARLRSKRLSSRARAGVWPDEGSVFGSSS